MRSPVPVDVGQDQIPHTPAIGWRRGLHDHLRGWAQRFCQARGFAPLGLFRGVRTLILP